MDTSDSEDSNLVQEDIMPWHWSATDKSPHIELNSTKTSALFHPENSLGCNGVRGITTFGNKMEHYFEVEMVGPFFGHARMVGIGTGFSRLESAFCDFSPLLGRDEFSYGINYSGTIHHNGTVFPYRTNVDVDKADRLIVGVFFDTLCHCLSFSINGLFNGIAYKGIDGGTEYYPIICSSSQQSAIRLTACRSSVASLRNWCRLVITKRIGNPELMDKLPLPPPLVDYIKFRTPFVQHGVKESPPTGKESMV